MYRILASILVIAIAAAAGWAGYSWYRGTQGGEPYGGAFTLIDQRGQTITERAFRGQPSAVFFGFTHCPDVCPTTLYEMTVWLEELGSDAENVRPYFITVDPERDTPEVLQDYISAFSERITGITGTPEDIAGMLRDFGIYARRVESSDGSYTMDHTASVILLDSHGAFFGTIAYGESPDTAKAKLKRLAGG